MTAGFQPSLPFITLATSHFHPIFSSPVPKIPWSDFLIYHLPPKTSIKPIAMLPLRQQCASSQKLTNSL